MTSDLKRKVVKGRLGNLTFQLNPSEMQYSSGAEWVNIQSPGMTYPKLMYSKGKPPVVKFRLWFNQRHYAPVNMHFAYDELHKYRNGRELQVFAYGSFVGRVAVINCDFDIQAWRTDLRISEFWADVELQFSA